MRIVDFLNERVCSAKQNWAFDWRSWTFDSECDRVYCRKTP